MFSDFLPKREHGLGNPRRPRGLSCAVGRATVSGVVIARALLRTRRSCPWLDEATQRAGRAVLKSCGRQALDRLSQGRTTLVIAHPFVHHAAARTRSVVMDSWVG